LFLLLHLHHYEDDKLKYEIELNGLYLGHVKMDVWTQKWFMEPCFKMPYNFSDVAKNKYESSYEAGKEMVGIYNFLYPQEEEQDLQEYGISLDDMLVFLKERI
jgi:hypothetical protein